MILVSGASGHLGALIVGHLQRMGADVVGGSRSPGKEGRLMNFDDPATLDLSGINTLVLVSAGYAEDDVVVARHSRVIERAARDGVQHVVYTSLVSEGDHLGFALAHRATERLLRTSGLSWTVLRNGLYAELVGSLLLWNDERLLSPFAHGAVAAPRRDDLALAAALVAQDPAAHENQAYELTGPAFSAWDIAHALGVPIADTPLGEYRHSLMQIPGLLAFQPPMLASIATSIRHAFLAEEHPDLEHLLGRAPKRGLDVALRTAAANRNS